MRSENLKESHSGKPNRERRSREGVEKDRLEEEDPGSDVTSPAEPLSSAAIMGCGLFMLTRPGGSDTQKKRNS